MPNKINKIIFFVENLFSERDYKRFGIELLRNNGYEVEIWDFTPFLRSDYARQIHVKEPDNRDGYKKIYTKKELKSMISDLNESSFVVCLLGYEASTYSVYKAISGQKIRYSILTANSLPSGVPERKKSVLMEKWNNFSIKNLMNFIFSYIPYNLLGIKPATIIMAGGEKSLAHHYPTNKDTEVLWLHSFDYDLYLEQKSSPTAKKRTGIFLDEYYPFHPDFIYSNQKSPVKPEEYYPLLCRFFTFLENRYNIEIIIAAHPRSDYENKPDYFEGRKVVKGKTVELVKDSCLCIIHSSTSVNFIVLYEKPAIFISTDNIDQSIFGSYIKAMAAQLGEEVFNLDENIESSWKKELKIDNAAYSGYKKDYIKSPDSEDLLFWQIFANKLKNL